LLGSGHAATHLHVRFVPDYRPRASHKRYPYSITLSAGSPGGALRRASEAENVLLKTKGVTIDRSQMHGVKAAVAAILKALDDPSAVERLGAIQIGQDFAQQRDFASAFCQHALHAVEYCSLETFDVDLDQAHAIEIDFPVVHIIIEGDNLDGDIFREFARVVEEAGSERTRPDTGVVIVEILRAGGRRRPSWSCRTTRRRRSG
jgi:hypothetical protein